MADVQPEDGYRRIATDLLRQLTLREFSKRQYKVLLVIVDLTYGWDLTSAAMTVEAIAIRCGLARQHVLTTLEALSCAQVIHRDKMLVPRYFEENGKKALWLDEEHFPRNHRPKNSTRRWVHVIGIDKDYDRWRIGFPKKPKTVFFKCADEDPRNTKTIKLKGLSPTKTIILSDLRNTKTITQTSTSSSDPHCGSSSNKKVSDTERSRYRKKSVSCPNPHTHHEEKKGMEDERFPSTWTSEDVDGVPGLERLFAAMNKATGHQNVVFGSNERTTFQANRTAKRARDYGYLKLTQVFAAALEDYRARDEREPEANWMNQLAPETLFTEKNIEHWLALIGGKEDGSKT